MLWTVWCVFASMFSPVLLDKLPFVEKLQFVKFAERSRLEEELLQKPSEF